MHVTKITIGRLFSLGNYEHVRYELMVEIREGESATTALEGVERIFAALNPKETGSVPTEIDVKHDERRVQTMKDMLAAGADEFDRYYGHGFTGTPEEYIARCEQSLLYSTMKREVWKARAKAARALLDDLGGAAKWHDAKLTWEDSDF